jgi:hypothetical protein
LLLLLSIKGVAEKPDVSYFTRLQDLLLFSYFVSVEATILHGVAHCT